MNIVKIFNNGDSLSLAVILILIAMSFASWYIIFWKSMKLKAEYQSYQKFLKNYLSQKNWSVKILNNYRSNNFNGSIAILIDEFKNLQPILIEFDYHTKKEILQMHLIQKLDEIRFNFDKGLSILASIGSSAPFIGLFGTVWGIHNALQNIALSGNAGINIVSAPIAEALVATAIGLFSAIPAVLAYNSFIRFNRLLIQNLRHIAEQLTIYNRPQI